MLVVRGSHHGQHGGGLIIRGLSWLRYRRRVAVGGRRLTAKNPMQITKHTDAMLMRDNCYLEEQ